MKDHRTPVIPYTHRSLRLSQQLQAVLQDWLLQLRQDRFQEFYFQSHTSEPLD